MAAPKKDQTFGAKATRFYRELALPTGLPEGVESLHPYADPATFALVEKFFGKFFDDSRERVFALGINPGRFGSGLTGVTFTCPVTLREDCGIANDLGDRREASADFIYRFVQKWGGAEKFYGGFFLTAVSPIGFVKDGVNYNYYDDAATLAAARPWIERSIEAQLDFGARRDVAILIGAGKNLAAFSEINRDRGYFGRIVPVEHPRFVMQCRRKKLDEYLARYEAAFAEALRG